MAIYKDNVETNKPTNLGVQAKDPQSLVDYFAGVNGLTQTFNASEYDAVVGFFEGKSFSKLSAETVAYIILTQAKIDKAAYGYKSERRASYPSIREQLDMQYWDKKNGTTTWVDAITKVKTNNPKP